ncbi:GAK9 protein, partial [Pteruthius melanotis]|nr:GAK9 protein [Pteruthius melanotis]
DKIAKKLGKTWRWVQNVLLKQQAEKRAAQEAVEAYKRNAAYSRSDEPRAPSTSRVILPAPGVGSEGHASAESPQPSAPPLNNDSVEPSADSGDILKMPMAPPVSDPVPGAESDLWEEMAKQRREVWQALARHGMESGDSVEIEAAKGWALPVIYTPGVDGNGQPVQVGEHVPLDWKILSQLRQTVNQYGFKSEPAKQMIDYIFDTHLLLPNELRSIIKLIFTQHQQLLFNAHWQAEVNASVMTNRGPGDPLHGVTIEELMGSGAYLRTEAQMIMGPDKVREAMRLVRNAIGMVKDGSGVPIYMGIKQGREESLGAFVDRVAAAIDRAGVADYMKSALLKQCALQNSNEATKRVLATLGANWTIEEALERMALQPTGTQAFLVNAIKELGLGLQKQAESTQTQVLAALAPLRASANAAVIKEDRKPPSMRCYRCGGGGHMRRTCRATGVWCQSCQSNTHNSSACRRRPGNSKQSAIGGRAQTQIAAVTSAPPRACSRPQQGAWDSTWQQQ